MQSKLDFFILLSECKEEEKNKKSSVHDKGLVWTMINIKKGKYMCVEETVWDGAGVWGDKKI